MNNKYIEYLYNCGNKINIYGEEIQEQILYNLLK